MASPLRPQFFCTRPNGSLTPLIAVDDLPAHVSLRGVPRVLSASDTQGMTSLGTVSPRSQSYIVDGLSPRASPTGYRGRDDLQSTLLRFVSDENLPASQRLALHALLQQSFSQNWGNMANNGQTHGWVVPSASGSGGARQGMHYNVKKEYCSYWIRHGECDYQQQGCLYKHEMPTDPAMLEKLGLRDIPRWYREKYSIPSLLPNGGARSQVASGPHWKDEAADRGALKSIQYPSRLGLNSSAENFDAEKNTKQQVKTTPYIPPALQPSATITGHARPAYNATNSPKGPASQKHGPKHTSNPTTKKIDLLSFDPIQEKSFLDPMAGAAGEMNYPNTNDKTSVVEEADRIQREEFVRSLQSLMPASMTGSPEYQQNIPLEPRDHQNRTRKFQKSRRLYQPRSQSMTPDAGHHEPMESVSFKNLHSNATGFSSGASAISKGSNLASPITLGSAMSSDPPTRVASPSLHSHTSMSSESSPRVLNNRVKDKDMKSIPAAIGTKRTVHRQRSPGSSDDDLFCTPMGRGK
ncbi:hypothetical protein ASPWEDRAFT_22577 [Aspergillus wentii DTO 134E9]|uniref:C3H1-type domain-containing protein n=1 Tax=Aspergillus wentii DTO 134E9 TaxID=1073089 RepID=A0A1L9RZP5_ASPWE|nr:uncharacterized protein ASPWEDRAFT_22577 [Aspergillus wentii DTO 134E9]KAI9932812.1 hypothetical protein MW887_009064 [Aspergillus wentii]OJJ40392.1 hypothetical protein ASPWEDRAFT_22577 [Aspergillus wentii DTO 134E9]